MSASQLVERLKEYAPIIPALSFVVFFLLAPLAIAVLISSYRYTGLGYEPSITAANYLQIFSDPTILGTILTTLRVALTVTALSLLLGYPIAYFTAMKVKKPALGILVSIFLLVPFWIDWSIRSIAWYPILGRYGAVNTFLVGTGLIREPSDLFLFSEFSAIFVMVQSYVLFMAAPISLSLAKIDPVLLQAAATLGANRIKTFRLVIFPLSKPGVIIGSLFNFIMTIADFATPRLVGGTLQTIGLSIAYQMTILNWPLAAALSLIVILLTLVIVLVLLKAVDIKRLVF